MPPRNRRRRLKYYNRPGFVGLTPAAVAHQNPLEARGQRLEDALEPQHATAAKAVDRQQQRGLAPRSIVI